MAKGIEKKLDDLWSYLVKARDKRCQYCNSPQNLNSHHLHTRSRRSTRWDLDNGITLCVAHHHFSNDFSAHITGIKFTHWLEELKGKEWVKNLERKSDTIKKWTKKELEEKLEEFKKLKKEYEN